VLLCGTVCCSVLQCVLSFSKISLRLIVPYKMTTLLDCNTHCNAHCNTHCNAHCNTLQHTATRTGKTMIVISTANFIHLPPATPVQPLSLLQRHSPCSSAIFDESGQVSCVAVRCSVLQCVAGYCRVLQCVAVCCSVLQCVVVRCSVLQCVVVRCSVL